LLKAPGLIVDERRVHGAHEELAQELHALGVVTRQASGAGRALLGRGRVGVDDSSGEQKGGEKDGEENEQGC
jgi:hypothetical protein